jgi:hypothetical protein
MLSAAASLRLHNDIVCEAGASTLKARSAQVGELSFEAEGALSSALAKAMWKLRTEEDECSVSSASGSPMSSMSGSASGSMSPANDEEEEDLESATPIAYDGASPTTPVHGDTIAHRAKSEMRLPVYAHAPDAETVHEPRVGARRRDSTFSQPSTPVLRISTLAQKAASPRENAHLDALPLLMKASSAGATPRTSDAHLWPPMPRAVDRAAQLRSTLASPTMSAFGLFVDRRCVVLRGTSLRCRVALLRLTPIYTLFEALAVASALVAVEAGLSAASDQLVMSRVAHPRVE